MRHLTVNHNGGVMALVFIMYALKRQCTNTNWHGWGWNHFVAFYCISHIVASVTVYRVLLSTGCLTGGFFCDLSKSFGSLRRNLQMLTEPRPAKLCNRSSFLNIVHLLFLNYRSPLSHALLLNFRLINCKLRRQNTWITNWNVQNIYYRTQTLWDIVGAKLKSARTKQYFGCLL